MMSMFKRKLGLLVLVALLTACNAYGPKPTPAQSPTPKPTVPPAATVGPLTSTHMSKPGVTLSVPAGWKPPVSIDENQFILSPDGSTDTSYIAGPFVMVIVGDTTYFLHRLSFATDTRDPIPRLDAMIQAINRDASSFSPAAEYTGAKYPAAFTIGYERNNELAIILLKASNDHWIYVGLQSKELYYDYYNSAVFKPLISSITLD